MNYRDDLIQRLKDSAKWAAMPEEHRSLIENCTDHQAREILVTHDMLHMGDLDAVKTLVVGHLLQLHHNFDGALFDLDDSGVRLSDVGFYLAEFFNAVRAAKLSVVQIARAVGSMDALQIAALLAQWEECNEDEGNEDEE